MTRNRSPKHAGEAIQTAPPLYLRKSSTFPKADPEGCGYAGGEAANDCGQDGEAELHRK
ncbi:MAG: hypothetical protein IPM21_07080 [Acidobacteria bacterium]|nr:hypothetical protein [Acidobacteriota bacterium]